MRVLLLRLQAPLMSFGGTAVDSQGVTLPFPGRSMLTGLLANALGWTHGEHARLNRLQARLRIASRCDQPGHRLRDYQTVDLGQGFMRQGWTTWDRPEGRGGGSSTGTHIRHRDYWADRIQLVALTLTPQDEDPELDVLLKALQEPARPLFIGRKPCIPSAPIAHSIVEAEGPEVALRDAPRLCPGTPKLSIWSEQIQDALTPIHDLRDWRAQMHLGESLIGMERITLPPQELIDG